MRIVIDMQGAQTVSRLHGIGRYTHALVPALLRLGAGEHEFWLMLNCSLPRLSPELRHRLSLLLPPERFLCCHLPEIPPWVHPANRWWQRAGEDCREAFLADLRPDWVLVTSLFEGADQSSAVTSVGNIFPQIPTAVILYDLIPLLNAESYLRNPEIKSWYNKKIEQLLRADILLSISEYARREALEALSLPPERVVAIGTAYDADLFCPGQEDVQVRPVLRERFGITEPYLMYNGALEPRKNLDGLIRAYALLPLELRQRYQLVFVGTVSAQDRQRLCHLARDLGCAGRLVLTGRVDDADLIQLFRTATLFVFPSLHEGFGLPALEAMACGAPTIGSNCTSIPEVIGRDDALFDPHDPQDMAAVMSRVLRDPVFARQLHEYGLRRARRFSWENCARTALEALEAVRPDSVPTTEDWAALSEQRRQRYRQLMIAIAALGAVGDEDLKLLAACIAANQRTADPVFRAVSLGPHLRWRIEGPFDSSYSLALLNRETALALESLGHQVALHSTEGPGDFAPAEAFLAAHPDLARLHRRAASLPAEKADVISRNLYPPRVADLNGRFNLLHHFAWEESGLPAPWVDDFNLHLQGITCLSSHVRKILIDNGVETPLAVSGCGVDHWQRLVADDAFHLEARGFRFLHVSSCFPRKGVDVLLKAYGMAFTEADDVTLVIKTFANPHNELPRWLSEARSAHRAYPHVVVLEEDLPGPCLKALYEQCHALVAPSRAEGFGLPLAEAMLSGLAVVTTGWGGQLDFCNDQTAWLVNYHFAPAHTHFDLSDSVWAEPETGHLAQCLREVFLAPAGQRSARSQRGVELLCSQYRWNHVAERLVAAARRWARPQPPAEPRIGWVTTWSTRCGIATYSQHLIGALPAAVTVLAADPPPRESVVDQGPQRAIRCWQVGRDSLQQLSSVIEEERLDTLVIQFNYYFYDFNSLADFLENHSAAGRILVLTIHATVDPPDDPDRRLALLVPVLRRCHRLLVHTHADLNRLKALGLVENVTLFPHGLLDYRPHRPNHVPRPHYWRIGSYGFFLPHKGLLELIESVALLRDQGLDLRLRLVNAAYPIAESLALIEQAQHLIHRLRLELNCELYTDFLEDAQSLALLEECDLIVFPYQQTGESASGAVRYGLATGRPVAVTPLAIFDDVADAVLRLPGTESRAIAEGIASLLRDMGEDNETLRHLELRSQRWRDQHRYSRLGNRFLGMCRALRNQV